MSRRLYILAVCVATTMGGCWLSHGAPSGDAGDDSDARGGLDGAPSSLPDAGSGVDSASARDSVPWATAEDGGDPLPDDEPDVEPGARPSDGPGADEWTDPPPATPGDPCCELIGEPVPLDDPTLQGGPPAVAWNGHGWGVAWRVLHEGLWFRELDASARPLAPPRTHRGPGEAWVSLAWGNHRYGFWGAGADRSGEVGLVGILDEHGSLRAGFTPVRGLGHGRIARFAAIHGWAVAANYDGTAGDSSTDVYALRVDDSARLIGEPVMLAHATHFSDGVPSVVGLESRAVVVWAGGEGVMQSSLHADGSVGDASRLMTMHTHEGLRGRDGAEVRLTPHAIAAASFRDTVVVVGADASHIHAIVYDPFEDVVVGEDRVIGDSPTIDARLGVVGDSKNGLIGVCYPYGDGPFGGYVDGRGPPDADEIRFQLLGPTGEVRGEPVVVVAGLSYAAGCAVARAHDDFIVVWWHADGLDPGHGIVAQRVRPRD